MTTSLVDNGVNVEALLGAREVFADAPQAAQFQWRSTVSWVNGTHSRSDVQTFFGFGDEFHGEHALDGAKDLPTREVRFPVTLPANATSFSMDFAIDKPLPFEFKVAPRFED